MSMLPGVMF